MEHTRREWLRNVLQASGFAGLTSTALFTSGCAIGTDRTLRAEQQGVLTGAQIEWLDEVAETILPETDTPGAKTAQVGAFIAVMVADTMSPADQAQFLSGMQQLEQRCRQANGVGVVAASPEQRLVLLTQLDQERFADPSHYFQKIKELVVFGFFTSEAAYTQLLNYAETPGRYDPCVPYIEGSPLLARHA